MELMDFPARENGYNQDFFMMRDTYYRYLMDYVKHFELEKYFKFNTCVTKVRLIKNLSEEQKESMQVKENRKFVVEYKKNICDGENPALYEEFDYVIAGNGHNSVPKEVSIPGRENFKGKILSIHDFRKAREQEFVDENILVIGSSFSGTDFVTQMKFNPIFGKVNKKSLILSGNTGFINKTQDWKELIDNGELVLKGRDLVKVDEERAYFADGSSYVIGSIVICAGYLFKFPFFDPEDKIVDVIENNKIVYPLFLKSICAREPAISIIGLSEATALINNIIEKQVLLFKMVVTQELRVPSVEDMIKFADKEFEDGLTKRFGKFSILKLENNVEDWNYIKDIENFTGMKFDTKHMEFLSKIMARMKQTFVTGNFNQYRSSDYHAIVGHEYPENLSSNIRFTHENN